MISARQQVSWGVRAALCYHKTSTRNSREHNDAKALTLGGRLFANVFRCPLEAASARRESTKLEPLRKRI